MTTTCPTHVFLDVDGVLNAVQPGTPTWQPTGEPYRKVRVNGFEITYSPTLIAWLNEASKRPGIAFHWLTTWEHDAPTLLAPAIGLDASDWPVLGTEEHYSKELDSGWWKFAAVVDHLAAHEPVRAVWIDDDITFDRPALEWLDRHPRVRWLAPSTHIGITPAQQEAVDRWLATCPTHDRPLAHVALTGVRECPEPGCATWAEEA